MTATTDMMDEGRISSLLRQAGLKLTRQRLALGELLFAEGGRHVTAEMLYEEAILNDVSVSLATIYNTLHQLTGAGLLRAIGINGSKTYFDTSTSPHHHYYCEQDGTLSDIPAALRVTGLPEIPEGMEIDRVEVVVRLKVKTGSL